MPLVSGGSEWDAVQGLSSFAFQGTNAHAVLGLAPSSTAPLPSSASAQAQGRVWRRSRFWFTPPTRTLLHRCAVVVPVVLRVEAHFSTGTARSCLSYLLDHRIRGRVLLPGAAMFEMATSAVAELHSAANAAVLGVVLAAPMVLVPGAERVLSCTVACASGQLHVRSAGIEKAGLHQSHASAAAGASFSWCIAVELVTSSCMQAVACSWQMQELQGSKALQLAFSLFEELT